MSIRVPSAVKVPATRYAALSLLMLAACSNEGPTDDSGEAGAVEIRYTEYGIPHIRTTDYEKLGYGQGYAQARDNLCKIERGMLALDGELSRHFGPDAPPSLLSNVDNSLESDLYFRSLKDSGVVEGLVQKEAPLGPRSEVRQMVGGFVEGFNAVFAEQAGLECSRAAWLRPMTELDVYRRVYAVTLVMGQSGIFAKAIVTATPPVASTATRSVNTGYSEALAASGSLMDPAMKPGSNAVALGSQATKHGGGINVANPHIRWESDMRWWQSQLTIPGKVDVSGAALIGVPLIVMGHTAGVAWSITTAEESRRATLFELTLVGDSPTTYLVDGRPEAMQRRDVRVEVKRPDGTEDTVLRPQWWTRYGPVVSTEMPLPIPPWTAGNPAEPGHAYVVADANATNMRMLNTLFAFNHAGSAEDVLTAIRETQGVPWWTVVAADAAGQALFSQIQVIPNVPDEHAAECNTELGSAAFAGSGFAILDGSRSGCGWRTDEGAIEPGILGPGRMPFVLTSNYVENSNDSYWMPSADRRIEGMARILGDERSERSLRTRGVLAEIEAQLGRAPYTRQTTQDAVFSNRSHAADLAVDATVEMCRAAQGGVMAGTDGERVDVRDACEALSRWDHDMNQESRGALLFEKYWSRATGAAKTAEASLWTVPFDPEDPVNTPRGLDVHGPVVARAFADTVVELSQAAIPVDAELGEYQYVMRGGVRLPLGGGTDVLGVVNLLNAPFGPKGYTEPFNGSGYLHVISLSRGACPDAVTLLTYSQSDEASSPHHGDQTELYSQKRWVTERFCEDDIQKSPALETLRLER